MSDSYKLQGIDIDAKTIEALRNTFELFLPICEPQSTIAGTNVKRLDPVLLKRQFLMQNLDKTQPSLYKMVCELDQLTK